MNYLPAHNVSRPQYLKLSHALGTAAAHVLHQRFGVSRRNIGWSINVEIWKPQPNFQWVTSESKNMDDQWWPMTCWFYVPEPKVKLEECLDFFKTESHLQFAAVLVLWYGPMSDPWPSGNQDLRKEKKTKSPRISIVTLRSSIALSFKITDFQTKKHACKQKCIIMNNYVYIYVCVYV